MCPFISHLITELINRVYVFKKNTLFIIAIIAAANRIALLTAGNDGKEARVVEVGDTSMNQFHIYFRLVHTLALTCRSIHRNGRL